MARILYLSCHGILEYDEVSLFHGLGHEVFSPGAYMNPKSRGDGSMRPAIPTLEYDPDLVQQYHRIGAAHPGEDGKNHLTREFVDNFDVIIIMHHPPWVHRNWSVMAHKRVIWRTIGQSTAPVERGMQPFRQAGLQVVRYSPQERHIPHFCGQDALIRFYKDPEVYRDWNGNQEFVITFAQHMQQRGPACNYDLFEEVTRSLPRRLFGPGNEQPGFGMGKVAYDQLLQELRDNRVYFYTGTKPASYTLNFIEAWMTGIPIVAIGPRLGNAETLRDHDLYEIHHLIENGVHGFVSDDPAQLEDYARTLLSDKALADTISANARQEAIRHFGRGMIRGAWKAFLERS